MKVLVGLILISLLNTVCKAQIDTNTVTEKKVILKIQQLKHENINTIVCYYVKCTGLPSFADDDSCTSDKIVYVFWENKSKYFIQQFDNCKTHNAINTSPSFLQLIKTHINTILKEKILLPEIIERVNGKSVKYEVVRDHTCRTNFYIYLNGNHHIVWLDNFDVETKYLDDGHLNINYYHNQKTFLNKLKLIAEKGVSVLNKR